MLMSNKKARKMGGKVLTYGGLAYKAVDSGFDIASQTDRDGSGLRLALVRAMISSAKLDGQIDADEHTRIQAHIQSLDLSGDEKGFLFDQLTAPSDPITIARLASNDEQAA